ncbi:MAG: hypothetical protein ACYC6G_04345 [Desulfobaccales bacterium]
MKFVRRLTALLLLAGIIAFGMASGLPNPAWAQLDLQPADKHSTLPDKNLSYIRDDDFAKLMQDNLIKSGVSLVKDAQFLFQECYGGGMLDDLKAAFGTTLRWVGGSASRYDQTSGGQISTVEKAKEPSVDSIYVANPPQDYWTKALVPQLGVFQTLLQSLNNARDNDKIGVKGVIGRFENGQSIAANGGENLLLNDAQVTSHYAILWAGYADHLRHFTDIDTLRQALQTAWQGTNYQINILYGDGLHETTKGQYDTTALPASWNQGRVATKEGTFANLKAAMAAVSQNLGSDANFFFFASNHGGGLTDVKTTTNTVTPGNHLAETFTLTQGELLGMSLEQQTLGQGNPDTPILTIDYDNPDGGLINALVSLNGHLLGSLDPEDTETQFVVPFDYLCDNDVIDIFNHGMSTLTLRDQFFYTGGIDSNPEPVPAPPSMVLLGSGLIGLLGCGRRLKGLVVLPRG